VQVFQAAAAFIRVIAGTAPLVLPLEDLPWADSTSLGLALYLGWHLLNASIVLLSTYRDVEVGRQHPLEDMLRELVCGPTRR
jgi:predicted ATPase